MVVRFKTTEPNMNNLENIFDKIYITEPHSIQKRQASQSGPYIVELLVVVDKEFGDLFQQDYWKIKDYLTIYFWDVNMRFKTLWGVDVTFRVNSLLTMRVPNF